MNSRWFRALGGVLMALIVAVVIVILTSALNSCTPPSLATTGACPSPGEFRCHDLQLEACMGGEWTPAMPDVCGRPGIVCCPSRNVSQGGVILNCVAEDRCVP